jgi:hypothetical protein
MTSKFKVTLKMQSLQDKDDAYTMFMQYLNLTPRVLQ